MNHRARFLLAVLFALALSSCSKDTKEMKATEADVVGVYGGQYFDGIETLEVRADRTFRQKFERAGAEIYSLEGKWDFSAPPTIRLFPFMYLIDFSNQIPGKPTRSEGMIASFHRDPDRIEFGEWPYFVRKQKGK